MKNAQLYLDAFVTENGNKDAGEFEILLLLQGGKFKRVSCLAYGTGTNDYSFVYVVIPEQDESYLLYGFNPHYTEPDDNTAAYHDDDFLGCSQNVVEMYLQYFDKKSFGLIDMSAYWPVGVVRTLMPFEAYRYILEQYKL